MPYESFYHHWESIRAMLDNGPDCVVTSHVQPDGDAIGSTLALKRLLEQLGCEATAVLQDPTPRIYDFLAPPDELHVYDPDRDDAICEQADVVFVLDVADWERVGTPGEVLSGVDARTVCIDHHTTAGDFADVDIIVPEAPATGSLIAEGLRRLDGEMTRQVSEPLYVAIATDSGWFRFPNTTPETLIECAELARTGLNISQIYEHIYERYRWESIRLRARALNSLHADADGRLAWFVLRAEDFAAAGADDEDCEGFIDLVRTVEGVDVLMFFREMPDGRSKVSLRSKCSVDVGELAQDFGGGGHRKAAGITIAEPLDELIPRVIEATKARLNADGR